MQINVILGPAALRAGKYWVGVASGNRYCQKVHWTPERAIADAQSLEDEVPEEETPCPK